MKVLLFVLAAIASASAQSEGWCRCAAFVTYQYTEMMVYESAEIPIDNCVDDAKQCKNACTTQLNTMSDSGNLWYLTTTGTTVGQNVCTYLADHWVFFVHNHRVYGYYEICGGA
ncbi:hypothetical protein SK128_018604 [Halocaridina rubra]|uniref:Uncharacterized protein n=1 Tax=Halocaridina rubra TaxID=373956 RepID=A0AAN8XD88_HALRR